MSKRTIAYLCFIVSLVALGFLTYALISLERLQMSLAHPSILIETGLVIFTFLTGCALLFKE
ncbi:MAG TPA: hypothetical protein PKL83_01070 [bacterium]|nr:hypothetical protein [bacterium]